MYIHMHTAMHSLLTDLDTSNFTKAIKLASHKITLLSTSKRTCPIVQEQMSTKALSSIQSINFTVDHSRKLQQQQHQSIENLESFDYQPCAPNSLLWSSLINRTLYITLYKGPHFYFMPPGALISLGTPTCFFLFPI